jgi:hypothetical protein
MEPEGQGPAGKAGVRLQAAGVRNYKTLQCTSYAQMCLFDLQYKTLMQL